MDIYRDHADIPDTARGAWCALGNFDGVHLGHRMVIDRARRPGAAAAAAAALGIISFEPHPRQFFAPEAPPFRLMNAAAKAHRLEKLGVDVLFDLPFDTRLASMTDREFSRDVLARGLGVAGVVVGADFCFGKGRTGTADTLRAHGAEFGFDVDVVPLLADAAGVWSSSAIRAALAEGRVGDAQRMLGHWHRIEGVVSRGDQRGRDLGFPTANIPLTGLHRPRFGVYSVLVDVLDGPHKGRYQGAASLGVRPTFGENIPNLEVFVLDFSGDLYGAEISVALVAFQRPELKFDSLEALIAQMHDDVEQTRAILATTPA